MDPHRVDGAAGRFRSFFDQLADTFVERDDVVHQGALALLSKEHALISGPPGTAKSALATALLEAWEAVRSLRRHDFPLRTFRWLQWRPDRPQRTGLTKSRKRLTPPGGSLK